MGKGRRKQPTRPTEEHEQPIGPAQRVKLLWGPADRGVRGPKPTLTIDQIVTTAIAVADNAGLAALSMRRIADELGFATMALYRYLPGKDELIDLMADHAIGAPPDAPADAARDWASQLERWARADLALFRRHPWLLELVARTPVGPNWFAWLERAVNALSETGLTGSEKLAMVSLIDGHVRGAAQVFLGIARAEQTQGQDAWGTAFASAMERVIADGRFPGVASIAAEGGFGPGEAPSFDHFEFGLHRVLDGIDAYIRVRTSQPALREAPSRRRK